MERLEKIITSILQKKNFSKATRDVLELIKEESERRRRLYEGILSNTPDLAYIFDLNHRFIYANEALLKLWGMSWNEVIGKTLQENKASVIRERGTEPQVILFEQKIKQVIRTKKPVKGEVLSITGEPCIFEFILVPVLDDNGKIEAVAGTSRDITDRKNAEEMLKRELDDMHLLQKVSSKLNREGRIENLYSEILNTAVNILDAEKGSLQVYNEDENELHFKSQVGLSRKFQEYFSDLKPSAETSCKKALAKGQRIIVPNVKKSSVFSEEPLEVVLNEGILAVQTTPLVSRMGSIIGTFSTYWSDTYSPTKRQLNLLDLLARQAADLIEQRRFEIALLESRKKLRSTNETLEKRVAERTAELEKKTTQLRNMTAELTTAEHRERKRLASILHDDLQQLLIAAKMNVMQTGKHPEREKAAQLLDKAVSVARDLTSQLRPPVLYEAGLLSALDWLVTEMEERHNLIVTIDSGDEEYRLDDDVKILLFQCINELLFNVVKYADVDEAFVTLRENDEKLFITVDDKGCGFDTDILNKHEPGQGFGLFSVHERVAAMGGNVKIHSEIGKGTRIDIEMPTVFEQQKYNLSSNGYSALNNTGEIVPVSHPQDQISVLVVDDHAMVRRGIANVLLSDSRIVNVYEAGNGLEAMEVLNDHLSDVVLMDLNMPNMNGADATRRINLKWPDIPIIGMSVQDDRATKKLMLDAGATAFLPKSGDYDELINKIIMVTGLRNVH